MGLSAALTLLSRAPGLPTSLAAAQTRPEMRIADATAAEGRAVAGRHSVATSGTLSISASHHNSQAEIRVPTYPDDIFEPEQTFSVNLSNSPANLVRSGAEGQISNNDQFPEVSVIAIGHVTEPWKGGYTNAPFFVRLSNPASQDVTVRCRTESGSQQVSAPATPGDDFEAAEGVLTFSSFTRVSRSK